MPTVKFFTLGCKVNQYETQVMREKFIGSGFKELSDSQPADIYVINTCTVTQTADSKSRYLIHYAHRENHQAKIIVTGCYTELDSHKIEKIPGVTRIIKNEDKQKILELSNENNDIGEPNEIGISNFSRHTRAFLKVQDGCNNSCAYCKVPLVRGGSRSRPVLEIIDEAEKLAKNGFGEIVLCGICLGAYGKDLPEKIDLVDVIERLENIEGLLRIRLSSLEAGDISDRLIHKMAGSQKLCPHLHIPIQSGDDKILNKMQRSYTREYYSALINKIKKHIPQIALTTDVLVGFPEEDEENFQNTLNLIQEILPLKVHIFPYSPRKDTPAFNLQDKVSPTIIKQRIFQLKAIAKECALIYRKQFLNQDMEVLLEDNSRENPCLWCGFTSNYIKVVVESSQNLKNKPIPLKLKKISRDSLWAEFC